MAQPRERLSGLFERPRSPQDDGCAEEREADDPAIADKRDIDAEPGENAEPAILVAWARQVLRGAW